MPSGGEERPGAGGTRRNGCAGPADAVATKASNTVCMAHDFLPGRRALSNRRRGRDAPGSGAYSGREWTRRWAPPRAAGGTTALSSAAAGEPPRSPGRLPAAFVRSPHAHARVRAIDTKAAAAVPSVVAVYTARDLPGCARPLPPPPRPPP